MSAEPRLVHVDERLAVVDKPAGLVVHPAPAHRGDDPGRRARRPARRRRGPSARASSTGSTRTPAACWSSPATTRPTARLAAMIKRREVERVYLALVEGRPRSRTGTIDAPLGRDPRAPERRAVARPRRSRRRAPTSRCSRCCRPTPSSRLAWRPAARTRSAPTSPRSATRWPATRATATPGRHGLERQFLHAPARASSTRSPASGSSSRSELPRGPGGGARAGASAG